VPVGARVNFNPPPLLEGTGQLVSSGTGLCLHVGKGSDVSRQNFSSKIDGILKQKNLVVSKSSLRCLKK